MQSSLSPTEVVDQALAVRATQAEQDRAFLALSAAQRAATMWRFLGASDADATAGEPVRLTMNTLYRWAQRFPHEVPLLDGEFAFIAVATPEIADAEAARVRTGAGVRKLTWDPPDASSTEAPNV